MTPAALRRSLSADPSVPAFRQSGLAVAGPEEPSSTGEEYDDGALSKKPIVEQSLALFTEHSVALTTTLVFDEPFKPDPEALRLAVSRDSDNEMADILVGVVAERLGAALASVRYEARIRPIDAHNVFTPRLTKSTVFDGLPFSYTESTRANANVPLLMIRDREGFNTFAFGVLDGDHELTVKYEVDSDNALSICFERRIARNTIGEDFHERLFLSKRKASWFDVVRRFSASYDALTGFRPRSIPESAYDAVYCTWYPFHRHTTERDAEENAAIAASLGIKTFVLDAGWSVRAPVDDLIGFGGMGDWRPVETLLPDFAGHVRRVKALGLRYMLWIAPFMVGHDILQYPKLRPHLVAGRGTSRFEVLCPRDPFTKDYLLKTLTTLLIDYDLDGFKFDFLDSVPASCSSTEHKHVSDDGSVSLGMLLDDISAALREIKPDVLIEFRQNYANLRTRNCATAFRAGDTPFDFDYNRHAITRIRSFNTTTSTHFDPIIWDHEEDDINAARQMISSLFSVPTVSMDLRTLPHRHMETLRRWIAFYDKHRSVLVKSRFKPVVEGNREPVLIAEDTETTIAGYFYRTSYRLPIRPTTKTVYVINASPTDSLPAPLFDEPFRMETYGRSAEHPTTTAPGIDLAELPVAIGGYCRFSR